MQKINIKPLLADWARKEKEKIEAGKKRRYLHFDARINSVGKRLVEEISNPEYVVRRFFIHSSEMSRLQDGIKKKKA
jgi:hypothetical protein